jgi:hypothetical protein
MGQIVEINEGEVLVKFNSPTIGKISFKDLGISKDELSLVGGFMRIAFELGGIGTHNFVAVPTIEISYDESMGETHWQCDFNDETLLDKLDHHGHATILLLKRERLENLEQHHENKLVLHAEFPGAVHINVENSYIELFK